MNRPRNRRRTPTTIWQRWAQIIGVGCLLYAPPILIAQIVEHIAPALHR